MPLAEDVVIDLFTGGIEYGNAGSQVFGHAVGLYGITTGIVSVVEEAQGFRHYFVVGIEEYNHVVLVGRIAFHDLLNGIDLGTLVFVGYDNVDRHLQQRQQVCFGQLGGGNGNVVFFTWIMLRIQKVINGFNNLFAVSQYSEHY